MAPPTFLTTMFFWEEGVAGANPWHHVKLDQKRGMHAEQEYVYFGPPPRAGAKLTDRHPELSVDDAYAVQERGMALRFSSFLRSDSLMNLYFLMETPHLLFSSDYFRS